MSTMIELLDGTRALQSSRSQCQLTQTHNRLYMFVPALYRGPRNLEYEIQQSDEFALKLVLDEAEHESRIREYFGDTSRNALAWLNQMKSTVEHVEAELLKNRIGNCEELYARIKLSDPVALGYFNGTYTDWWHSPSHLYLQRYKKTEYLEYTERMMAILLLLPDNKWDPYDLFVYLSITYQLWDQTPEESSKNTRWMVFFDFIQGLITRSHEEVTNSGTEIFEIPGHIENNHSVAALGDYCAKHNFMREKHAIDLSLPIKSGSKSIVIGSGKTVFTTGTVQTQFCFQHESRHYPLTFHLLPDCIHDVILGKPFLKLTRTFSSIVNFGRRVKKRLVHDTKFANAFCYLGDSAPRFAGLVNGAPQEALADSGAKVMLMDEAYARRMKIPILKDQNHPTKLVFANGSTAETSGMAYQVKWQFGGTGDERNEDYFLDFHIMKNAPAPVILNDSFLFNNQAFSKYEQYLIDEDDPADDESFNDTFSDEAQALITSILFAINLIKTKKPQTGTCSPQTIALIQRCEAKDAALSNASPTHVSPAPSATLSPAGQVSHAPKQKRKWRFEFSLFKNHRKTQGLVLPP